MFLSLVVVSVKNADYNFLIVFAISVCDGWPVEVSGSHFCLHSD